MVMTRNQLMKQIDTVRIEDAIHQAESRSSGEICVSVSTFFWGSVRATAESAFKRLKVSNTAQHNGVLIFVVPSRRQFVVLGDSGIHEKVGAQFWTDMAEAISALFKQGDFTGGIVKGIEVAGAELSTHFPPVPGDVNELPDKVDFA